MFFGVIMDMKVVFLSAVFLVGESFNFSYACTPALGEKPASIAEKAQASHYVFDGTVIEIGETHIKVQVEQYLKGVGSNEVRIAHGTKENSCADHFVLNQRALFFTKGEMGQPLEAVYDGAFGSIRAMTVDNFNQMTATKNCMATYENGRLIVPCISHKGFQKIYQAMLVPVSATEDLTFSINSVSPVSNIQSVIHFDQGILGEVPDGWEQGITGQGITDWQLVQDSTAPSSSLVLQQAGEGDFPWCVKKESRLTNGFVAVKFKTISGQVDQAAGLIWRWKDANNYYVARANALEDNISIYYMKEGVRHTLRYENVPGDLSIEQEVWQTLRVDFQGNHFIVSFEGRSILDTYDRHIEGEGAVGLWTKEDSVISFDDFSYGKSE